MLPEQQCVLNKQKTNLLFLAPSMQVKVLFCSASNTEKNISSMNPTSANTTQNEMSEFNASANNSVKTHIFTASLPLKHVLQQLMNSDTIVHQAITSEDENKVWQLHLSIADKTPLSAYECQKRHEQFSLQLDTIMAHEAWVRSEMGYCETLLETATAVTAARLARKAAAATVLKSLTNDELPTTWDLQMSRPLNIAMTPEGPQPMKLGEIRYLRTSYYTYYIL
jgi:hypothetical protein